ncbi:MAG TPA: sigma-70 family RNA polymerase sigma factor, partial [Polyangiaceae bacterium]
MSLFRFGRNSRTLEQGRLPLPDLRAVYDAHAEFLWKSLFRMGIAEADLPDAMQDVLVVLSRKLDQFDGDCKLTTFLYGICLRVAATARRTKQRRREDKGDPELHMANIISSSDPEMAVARTDARRRLLAA